MRWAAFFILLAGVARLYMGVHWPFDVLGGIFFSVVCTYAADYLMEAAERKNRRHMHLLMIPPVLLVVFLWSNSQDLVKAAGIFCSFLAGCSIEGQWIRFETKTVFGKQTIKLALGLRGVLLFKSLLKSLLPEAPVYEFLRYFVIGIWITVGAPAFFGWLRLNSSIPKAASIASE